MALIRCNTSGGGASVVPVTLIDSAYSAGVISKTIPIEDGKRYIIIGAYARDQASDFNTCWIYENDTLTQTGTGTATTSGTCEVSGNNIVYTHSQASFRAKVFIFEC